MAKSTGGKCRAPCSSCPWRRDKVAADIPNFRLDLAEHLAGTCPDVRGMGPSYGASWFACHHSAVGNEIPCAGWLAVVGSAHPGVRISVMEGRTSPQALRPGDDWPALHASYSEVLDKLRASEVRVGQRAVGLRTREKD